MTQAFDLVLLDVSLPDGNGFSICAEIKREYEIPVIFLTASGDEYSVVAGLDMGADDFKNPLSSSPLQKRTAHFKLWRS